MFRGDAAASRTSQPIMWNGQPVSDEEFFQAMEDESRLIYEFEVHKQYGML